MELIIRVDLSTPRWLRRALVLGVPVAAMAFTSVAVGAPPTQFAAGNTLKAADLNANFNELDGRLVSAEAKIAALEALPKPLTVLTQVSVPPGEMYFADCIMQSGTFPQGACARMASAYCKKLNHLDGWFEGDLQGSNPVVTCAK